MASFDIVSGCPESLLIRTRIDKLGRDIKNSYGTHQIMVANIEYGLDDENATLLACSFDEIERRYSSAGRHIPVFDASIASATDIARSVLLAVYSEDDHGEFMGLKKEIFLANIYGNALVWAPDGDQAFDDGSMVLQMDIGDQVRVVGFKNHNDDFSPSHISDVWLNGEEYYRLLREWIIQSKLIVT